MYGELVMLILSQLVLPIVLMLVAASALIIGHELAHVLTGLAVGFRIESIELGRGRSIVSFRTAGVLVTSTLLPLDGYVRFRSVPFSSSSIRHSLVQAAGPVFHLCVGTIPVVLIGVSRLFTDTSRSVTGWRVFVLWNVMLCLVSAVPHSYRIDGEIRHSDGRQLIRALQAFYSTRLLDSSDHT